MKRVKKYIFHIDHLIITATAFLFLSLFGLVTFNVDFLNPVERSLDNFSLSDMFFQIEHSSEPEKNGLITLVDMTELHSRGDIAMLLEQIDECHPLCVGVDLIFEGEKEDSIGNVLLKEVISNSQSDFVFSSKLIEYNEETAAFDKMISSFCASQLNWEEAYTNVIEDDAGGTIRNLTIKRRYGSKEILSFPARIASVVDNSNANNTGKDMLINYGNEDFIVVPYNRIEEYRDLLEGRIVLVGSMKEEGDMHNTPLGKLPGLQVQAYSLLTLLEHKHIASVPTWLGWSLSFIICYILEIVIDFFYQVSKRHPSSVIMVFFRESNFFSVLMLFTFSILLCWLMFIFFVDYDVLFCGEVTLALMALTCVGRDVYMSVIKAFAAKYHNKFINASLMTED